MRSGLCLFLILGVIAFACKRNKDKPHQPSALPGETSREQITICHEGGVEFDRSYSFLMSMDYSEKEMAKMMEETANSNPDNRMPADTRLKKRFEQLGFVDGDELLLHKFKYSSNPDTSITTATGHQVKIRFKQSQISTLDYRIVIYSGNDSTEIKTYPYMGLEYALLDVVPGGNKEIIILNERYLANNELYDFDVYEIKTGD